MNASSPDCSIAAVRVSIFGRVQGIGFRPAIARLADRLKLTGWVKNSLEGVEVHVEGSPQNVARFVEQCESICPSTGSIFGKKSRAADSEAMEGFQLRRDNQPGPCSTSVPVDLVTCADCIEEIEFETDRRRGYLFTSCTNCGPRYSIIEVMPFERAATAMRIFPACAGCAREFQSPADRRFHAQTIACSNCGPRILTKSGVMQTLCEGHIVAVKGLGGYQLMVDAHNEQAVRRLRKLKFRATKPLAVLVADLAQAKTIAVLSPQDCQSLASPVGPIVIVQQRPDRLPADISPGRRTVGIMLPTTPIHHWIASSFGPVVATSGNREGEPLEFDHETAESHLSAVADNFLHHNRPIRRPIDDSVVRNMAGRQVTLRLARGLAPLTLSAFVSTMPQVLAVGAYQKVAVAFSNGRLACLGPHIGDQTTLAARQRFDEQVDDLLRLYGANPSVIAHDLHPDYFTTQWALGRARDRALRTISAQHHHAHIVAGMAEQNWLSRSVLGVAWDGTGLGTDGTIWGGEFLLANAKGFQRVAHLRPFRLPGGEAAISQPSRIAAAIVREVRQWDPSLSCRIPNESSIPSWLYESPSSPITTSAGRLFDAVAAMLLPDATNISDGGYEEGQLASMLEDTCNQDAVGQYPLPLVCATQSDQAIAGTQNSLQSKVPAMILDWRPLIAGVVRERERGLPLGDIAMRFHRSLAAGIASVCRLYEHLPVVLSGGVMQNRVLVELLAAEFNSRRLPIAYPGTIPPNDGGLAVGQLSIALAILEEEQKCA